MKNRYNKFKNRVSNLMKDFNIEEVSILKDTLTLIYENPQQTLRKLSKRGNRKVGTDTLIFNMGQAFTCPSEKLGLCKVADKCYAKKAETQYWATVSHNREQAEIYWKNTLATQFTAELNDIISKAHIPIKYLRFNESGDFYTQECVDKVLEIAKLMAVLQPKLIIYTYTARTDLNYTAALKQSNLVINGSGFMLDNNFDIAYKKSDLKSGNKICGGDCSICNYCKVKQNKVIKVKFH